MKVKLLTLLPLKRQSEQVKQPGQSPLFLLGHGPSDIGPLGDQGCSQGSFMASTVQHGLNVLQFVQQRDLIILFARGKI